MVQNVSKRVLGGTLLLNMTAHRQENIWTDQGLVQDGAVRGDGVLSLLHHGHLPAVVRAVCQAVDWAALGAGTDWHGWQRVGAFHAVDCAGAQHILLHILTVKKKRTFCQVVQVFWPVYVTKCAYPMKTLLSRHTVNMKQTNSETQANTIKVQPHILRIPSLPFFGEQPTGIKWWCKQRPLYGEEGALSSQYIFTRTIQRQDGC